MTEILLIHGPCSFTRSTWTAGNITKAGLLRAILDWLLNAKENEIIVLYCVGSLTDSPTILRDLELINNRVIVVSLNGVKSRYPTIYSRWCAVGLWAAIVQFGAGCGKESFCPAPRIHASWTRVLLTAMLNRLISPASHAHFSWNAALGYTNSH
ncbi:hypothetical protein PC128_g4877 [Phytophthora cactorum]|nr:hypothetical protein PC128_g4877 [Phytophthora cactorum]